MILLMRYDETGEGFLGFLSFSYPQFHYVPAGICKARILYSACSETGLRMKKITIKNSPMAITHNDFVSYVHVISLFPPCHVYFITYRMHFFSAILEDINIHRVFRGAGILNKIQTHSHTLF